MYLQRISANAVVTTWISGVNTVVECGKLLPQITELQVYRTAEFISSMYVHESPNVTWHLSTKCGAPDSPQSVRWAILRCPSPYGWCACHVHSWTQPLSWACWRPSLSRIGFYRFKGQMRAF